MRILIVDDSKTMRMIVKRTLRQAGYGDHETDEAENGAQALEMMRAAPHDLVLSDWNMPEMTGIELLEKAMAEGVVRKFGFVTSEQNEEMRKRAMSAGAMFLIGKPFTPESFSAALAPVVGAA